MLGAAIFSECEDAQRASTKVPCWPENVDIVGCVQDLAQGGVPALFGVGLTMNVEKLVDMATRARRQQQQQQQNAAQGARRLSGADVLVCSNGGGGMLNERMAITAKLWAAGVSAETLHVQRPSQKVQYDYAELHGMRARVTLHRGEFSARHVVKVCALFALLVFWYDRFGMTVDVVGSSAVQSSWLTRCVAWCRSSS